MYAQTTSSVPATPDAAPPGFLNRLVHFTVFLVCGLAVFVFGLSYFDLFPTNRNLGYDAALSAILLIVSLWMRRDARLYRYWRVAFAFFIASAVNLVNWALAGGSQVVLDWFNAPVSTSKALAIGKLYEVLLAVLTMLVLTRLSGAGLDTIYLKRGDLKLGLSIGSLVWLNLAASSFLFFTTRYTNTNALVSAVLWGLLFSFANSLMEELWLRGLLLGQLKPLLGAGGAVLLTSLLFSLGHAGALYMTPVAIPFYVLNTLTMGLACGWLILKIDSLWAAVLIHAGADFFLFIAMLAAV